MMKIHPKPTHPSFGPALPGSKSRRVSRTASGFTIVELLVVISIIAVLAALLFLITGKVRNVASTATCMNNQRELLVAAHSFGSEHSGILLAQWGTNIDGQPRHFTQHIAMYLAGTSDKPGYGAASKLVRNYSIFQCPEAAREMKAELSKVGGFEGWSTYAWNAKSGSLDAYTQKQNPWIDGIAYINQAAQPDKMILLAELNWRADNQGYTHWLNAGMPDSAFAKHLHNGRCHFGFLDGHVEALRPDEIPNKVGKQLSSGRKVSNADFESAWSGRQAQ